MTRRWFPVPGLALVAGAWLAAAAAAAASGPVQAPQPAVDVRVEPREVTVGDPIAARIVIGLPAGARAELPELSGTLGPFTVTGGSWAGPRPAGEGTEWVWSGTLAAFRTGELELPPIRVEIRGPGAASRSAASAPVTLLVKSVLPAEADAPAEIADLKPPVGVAPDYSAWIVALAVLAGALGLAWLASWLHRRLAGHLAAVPAPADPFQRVPPHEWAYAELQRLLGQRLPERGEVDLFFAEISRIVKCYLGGRFRVELLECTTAEVPAALAQAGAPPEVAPEAVALLSACDLVKFAGRRPLADECRESVERAYRLIDATLPAPALPPTASGAPAERGAA